MEFWLIILEKRIISAYSPNNEKYYFLKKNDRIFSASQKISTFYYLYQINYINQQIVPSFLLTFEFELYMKLSTRRWFFWSPSMIVTVGTIDFSTNFSRAFTSKSWKRSFHKNPNSQHITICHRIVGLQENRDMENSSLPEYQHRAHRMAWIPSLRDQWQMIHHEEEVWHLKYEKIPQ